MVVDGVYFFYLYMKLAKFGCVLVQMFCLLAVAMHIFCSNIISHLGFKKLKVNR